MIDQRRLVERLLKEPGFRVELKSNAEVALRRRGFDPTDDELAVVRRAARSLPDFDPAAGEGLPEFVEKIW